MALTGNELWHHISELFSYLAIIVSILIVPYCMMALHAYETNRKVRYVRRHEDAHFWPSLYITTWLTRANAVAITYLVLTLGIRVYFRYEEIGHSLPQPTWSYLLSMFGTVLLLTVLMMPATFHLWVKREIKEASYDDEKITAEDH